MVVDVGERRQPDRIRGPDGGPQRGDVLLGLRITALVAALGVDDQAVGARRHGARALRRLAERIGAVDELPRAHLEAVGVQGLDQRRVELRPRIVRAVRALDEHGRDAGRPRPRRDGVDVPALALRQLPDPHPVAGERRRKRAGGDPALCGYRQHHEPDHARAAPGAVGDAHRDRSGLGPGRDTGHPPRRRAPELGRQRPLRPAKAHAHPGLEPRAAKLDLLADHDLRARVADGTRRGHASQPGQLRRRRPSLRGRRRERRDEQGRDREGASVRHLR